MRILKYIYDLQAKHFPRENWGRHFGREGSQKIRQPQEKKILSTFPAQCTLYTSGKSNDVPLFRPLSSIEGGGGVKGLFLLVGPFL
ncbi:hypothetical protein CEXT_625401 [Caerostris extrusa]|uniref:Uncharacterized protein n=1 Tax=Caerostris extrusa TaxID=172846 RepID=A0AAV4TYT7_CAEEX|nr:hypothetical protein CEXT_625401 [Caerostris extrusa]